MTTCEQCGANAVNAYGVCEQCGWRTAASGAAFDGSSPSLGETRAADVPYTPADRRPAAAPGTRAPITPMPPLERTTSMPNQTGAPRSTADARPRYSTAAPASTSRYCGTCGARIAPGEAFCGQCGTPVGAGSNAGTSLQPAASQYGRYQIDGDSSWSPGEGDAPTEAFVPSSAPSYARGFSSAPNARGGYASTPGSNATPANASARTGRIIVGVICLIGSLASAIGAIVLAVTK
ncbi:MAG: zinc-ribbon domain-containing protein [Ktedonobacterales bacterium]